MLISLHPIEAAYVRDFGRDSNFRNLNQYLYERRLQFFYRHLHDMNYGQTPGVLASSTGGPHTQPMDAALTDQLAYQSNPSSNVLPTASTTSTTAAVAAAAATALSSQQATFSPLASHKFADDKQSIANQSIANPFNQHSTVHPNLHGTSGSVVTTGSVLSTSPHPTHLQHLHHLHQTQQASNSSAEDNEFMSRDPYSSVGHTSQRVCKLPRNVWHQLSAGNNKCCYNVAYSPDGRKIGITIDCKKHGQNQQTN